MPQKAPKPVPEEMRTVTPYLTFRDNCSSAVEFYQKAFGAKVVSPVASAPDGKILNVMIRIGDSNLMMSDTFGGQEVSMGDMLTMWLYVDDCDTFFNNAVKAGCKVTMPLEDAFWGDRLGQVQDPYGYLWSIASWKWQLTPEEMKQKQDEWLRSAGK
jgi:PhnB protein